MTTNTGISWTDHTWNPWQGCTRVSPGCANCYMFAEREGRWGIPSGTVTRSSPATFRKPLSRAWRSKPAKVFTCSWSDWFHPGADEWRPEAWEIIRRSPHLTFQILTKRPERILRHLPSPSDWGDGWHNVWIGVSVESQAFMPRAELLAEIPAAVRFVSAEPLLGPLEFEPDVIERLHWIIGGGESGPNARPAMSDWFEGLAATCHVYNIPYWHKQNGGSGPDKGGNLLNGRRIQEFPR